MLLPNVREWYANRVDSLSEPRKIVVVSVYFSKDKKFLQKTNLDGYEIYHKNYGNKVNKAPIK
jgi:hypothetical protein